MSGCFQKGKGWKTKEKIETEFSQNEKNRSQFETELNTPGLRRSIAPFGHNIRARARGRARGRSAGHGVQRALHAVYRY